MSAPADDQGSYLAYGVPSAELPKVAASLRATSVVQSVEERPDLGHLIVAFAPNAGANEIEAVQQWHQAHFPGLSFEPNKSLKLFNSEQEVSSMNSETEGLGGASPAASGGGTSAAAGRKRGASAPAGEGGTPADTGAMQPASVGGTTPPAAGAGGTPASGGGSGTPPAGSGSLQTLTTRPQEYLISLKPAPVLGTLGATIAPQNRLTPATLEAALQNDPNIQVVGKIEPDRGVLGVFAADPNAAPIQDVHKVHMTPEVAVAVSERIGQQAYVERNEYLRMAPAAPPAMGVVPPGIGVAAVAGTTLRVALTVLGKNNTPLAGAQIVIFGSQSSTQGVTDRTGQANLSLPGETANTIVGIVVTPQSNYWSAWIPRPQLNPNGSNTVTLRPLEQYFSNFPNQGIVGWGISAMNVDQLSPMLQGQGVKVAVVDTGIAAGTHQDLQGQVAGGYNIVGHDPNTWDQDDEGHGTHCAGVIGALNSGRGIRGIAPGVKLYSYKVFPGGQFSDLIDALNHCIQDRVDIVNLSLGTDQTSDLVEQWIQNAKQNGIACIVAAGNSSGPVQFPASSPNVLAVAAVGKQGTFPDGVWQATEAVVGNGVDVSSDGYFSPVFTNFGPDVSVCAPGVGIVSCFPPNDYAVMDGTSMATPHVVGLAALVLAHHPDFQGPYRQRNAQRVDRLFEIMLQGARQLTLGTPAAGLPRTGTGIVDAVRTLNVPSAAASPGPFAAPVLTPKTWANVVQSVAPTIKPAVLESASVTPADLSPAGVRPGTAGDGAPGESGDLHPQDWTGIVSAVVQHIPWDQVFNMFAAQPGVQPGGGAFAPQGVTPGGYGAPAGGGNLSPEDWTRIISSVVQHMPWDQVFSLAAQPGRGGFTPQGAPPGAYGTSSVPGSSPSQDWTGIISSVMQRIPWDQVFGMVAGQPGRGGGFTPQGVTPGGSGAPGQTPQPC